MSESSYPRARSRVFLDTPVVSPLRSPFERWRDSTDRSEGTDDDMISILTMETIDDNIGAGRTLSKYFFQPAGLRLEKFLNKVLGATLATPFEIGYQLRSHLNTHVPWRLSDSKITYPLDTIATSLKQKYKGMGTLSGLERLFRLCRSGPRRQRAEALLQILAISLQERDVFEFYEGMFKFKGELRKNHMHNLDGQNADILELLLTFASLLYCGRGATVSLKHDHHIQNMKNVLLGSLHEASLGQNSFESFLYATLSILQHSLVVSRYTCAGKVPRPQGYEALWLALITLIWITPPRESNMDRHVTDLFSIAGTLRDVLVTHCLIMLTRPNNPDAQQREWRNRVFGLFSIKPIASMFPMADLVARRFTKFIYLRAGTTPSKFTIAFKSEAILMKRPTELLTSIEKLKEAIEEITNTDFGALDFGTLDFRTSVAYGDADYYYYKTWKRQSPRMCTQPSDVQAIAAAAFTAGLAFGLQISSASNDASSESSDRLSIRSVD